MAENRPVLTGLLALVGVAVVIGLLGGLAGDGRRQRSRHRRHLDGERRRRSTATFRLPKPTDTAARSPLRTSRRAERRRGAVVRDARDRISLSAGQQSVSPMQQIDLTGTYPGGEGAILQVQRFENGAWSDFPVTMSVSGGTFATYVQTSQVGPNQFRVIDTDTQVASNELTVTVG